MTRSRDPLGDRPPPTVPPATRTVVDIPPVELADAELLAAFAATVARYLDSPSVAVAWGGGGSWQSVDLDVDLDRPFGDLVVAAAAALGSGSSGRTAAALPTWGVAPDDLPDGTGPALLALSARTGRADVAAGAYEPDDVRRFVAHLTRLAAARGSDAPVGRLPLVSVEERDLLVPASIAPAEQLTLVDLIRDRVEASPAAVAVRAAGRSLTYAELWARSGALASRLPARRLVGVWGDRSIDLMVGLVGVLRAGSAYVALEPSYPVARLQKVVELAGLAEVVAGGALEPEQEQLLAALDLPVLRTDEPGTGTGPPGPAPDDLAYVMFTSGSTGVPKGVMVEHRNVVNTMRHMAVDPGLVPGEAMLGVTTPAFDLSVPDLFLPLVTGATLVLAHGESHRDAAALARLIEEHRPRLMQATPSTWRLLLGSGWAGAPWMRVVCGGEAYDAGLVRALGQRVAGVWNFYGPTETTVWSVSTRLTGLEPDPLPLGAPMRGVACYLLDSRGEPTPPGIRGEIAIAGAGVARGYLDRPDLTRAAFVPCPFPGAPSERMYLTGDLARLSPDGTLRFAGRRDHQVKINGFRIELGEIEAAALSLPGVGQAVAVVHEDGELKRILCYVVGQPGGAPLDPEALREQIAGLLPPQSVPAVVMMLDAIPLTANGKLDRKALPTPGERSGVPLTGDLERLVAGVCADVLGLPVRFADDSVFALGADSLLVGRIAVRLTGDLGLDVAPGLVFRNPTVRELARALLGLLVGDAVDVLDELEATEPAK